MEYLAVAECRRISGHGGHVEQDERMRFVIQIGIGSNGAVNRVDGKVSIWIARIDGIAGAIRT